MEAPTNTKVKVPRKDLKVLAYSREVLNPKEVPIGIGLL
jgi:hypothetical protein